VAKVIRRYLYLEVHCSVRRLGSVVAAEVPTTTVKVDAGVGVGAETRVGDEAEIRVGDGAEIRARFGKVV
jgi:hypothetical protein